MEAVGRHQEAVNVYYSCQRYDQLWGGYLDFAKRTLRSRAVEVMQSMGFEPSTVRSWLAGDKLREAGFLQPVLAGAELGSGSAEVANSKPLSTLPNPPSNVDSILKTILYKTCEGTPVQPTVELLLPHPPEMKVNPYGSLSDEDGRA